MTLATNPQAVAPEEEDDPIDWASSIGWLLDSIKKVSPEKVWASKFAEHWKWLVNATDDDMRLDEPLQGPDGVRFQNIMPRYILIFFDDVFIGYISETKAGWGVRSQDPGPTIFDMVNAFFEERGIADELYSI